MTPLLYNDTATRAKNQALKQAWGDFVDQVGDRQGGWDWFATGTFRDRTREEQARGWTRVGWSYTTKAADAWLRHLGEVKGLQTIHWVRAREMQADRGVSHWHLFVGGVAELRRMDEVDWWHQRYGIARVLPYQRELGARFYLCKYLVKELGDIEFSPNLRLDK